MLKISVIFTGGTIASSEENDYISINSNEKKYKIIDIFKENFPEISCDTVFEFYEPYTILSENLNGAHINALISCVRENLKNDCDGIIVTHGTDTLQYSAASLGLAINDPKVPIILVSSNYILNDKRSNGLNNFVNAVKYIREKKKSGVFVSYDNEILNSLCLLPHIAFSDKLYETGKRNSERKVTEIKEFEISYDKVTLSDISPVLYLKAVPGQFYPSTDNPDIKAFLLETYHSGTLCTSSRQLNDFCEKAYKLNKPVYVVGVEDRIQYESTSIYEKLHLKVLKNESPVTAYMKLWFLYSKGA